jgi:hypothetical protein
MKKIYVRWLGAFAGRQYGLTKSINFEMARKDEAACEPLFKANHKVRSGVAYLGQVGLILHENAIFRNFKKDTWSFYGTDANKGCSDAKKDQDHSRLYARRQNKYSNHGEAWAHMSNAVIGFVVYGSVCELQKERRNALLNAVRKFNMPLYELTRSGELIRKEV